MQNNWIVITSIYNPRVELINSFPENWSVVVVGDLKTPHTSWESVQRQNFYYLDPGEQQELFPDFSSVLGYGTYVQQIFGIQTMTLI